MPRLSTEDKIKQLEAKIQTLKERAERKKIRKDPGVRFMKGALASIEKAIKATDDAVLRKSLDEARSTVSACLSLCGVTTKPARASGSRGRGKGARARVTSTENGEGYGALDANDLLSFLKNNPGSRSEQISAAFSTDASSLRPVMRSLIEDGKVRTEGERRGTRYFAGV